MSIIKQPGDQRRESRVKWVRFVKKTREKREESRAKWVRFVKSSEFIDRSSEQRDIVLAYLIVLSNWVRFAKMCF
jgi:hypothetical protein